MVSVTKPKAFTSPSPSSGLRSMMDGPGVILIQLFAVDIVPLQKTQRKTENKKQFTEAKESDSKQPKLGFWEAAFSGTDTIVNDYFSQQEKKVIF